MLVEFFLLLLHVEVVERIKYFTPMRNIYPLLFLIAFISCTEKTQNKLTGKWQLLSVSDKYFIPGYKYDPSVSTKKIHVTYLSDSVYITENEIQNTIDSFRYKLSNDTLYFKDDFHLVRFEDNKVHFNGGKREHESTIVKVNE